MASASQIVSTVSIPLPAVIDVDPLTSIRIWENGRVERWTRNHHEDRWVLWEDNVLI